VCGCCICGCGICVDVGVAIYIDIAVYDNGVFVVVNMGVAVVVFGGVVGDGVDSGRVVVTSCVAGGVGWYDDDGEVVDDCVVEYT